MNTTTEQNAPGVPEPVSYAEPQEATNNLNSLGDLEVPLSVRFGMTQMTFQQLSHLRPGSLLDLGRSPDGFVELVVSGRAVAYGQLVTMNGYYAVKITEVVRNRHPFGHATAQLEHLRS